MHQRFEQALQVVRAQLGRTHSLFIDGRDVSGSAHEERLSPIDRELSLGMFPLAQTADVEAALAAAAAAFPKWRATPTVERARALRRVADLMEQRVYEIAATMVLEVGKNRLEALGEAQECVDFFRYYTEDFETHRSYDVELPNDPIEGAV